MVVGGHGHLHRVLSKLSKINLKLNRIDEHYSGDTMITFSYSQTNVKELIIDFITKEAIAKLV